MLLIIEWLIFYSNDLVTLPHKIISLSYFRNYCLYLSSNRLIASKLILIHRQDRFTFFLTLYDSFIILFFDLRESSSTFRTVTLTEASLSAREFLLRIGESSILLFHNQSLLILAQRRISHYSLAEFATLERVCLLTGDHDAWFLKRILLKQIVMVKVRLLMLVTYILILNK